MSGFASGSAEDERSRRRLCGMVSHVQSSFVGEQDVLMWSCSSCLDDEELQFLGAPWDEYSCAANDIGLDILRLVPALALDSALTVVLTASGSPPTRACSLPTPEGLAPVNPAILDVHLTRLIQTYTLAGTPILVHCRGGVGRAGLIACCWALKLGLCGWIETQPTASLNGGSLCLVPPVRLEASDSATSTHGASSQHQRQSCSSDHDNDATPMANSDPRKTSVRRDTVQLAERAITLVRRRRSAKAVETFEQVKFLVDYVDFLREKAKLTRARDEGVRSVMEEHSKPLLLPNNSILSDARSADALSVAVDTVTAEVQIGSVVDSGVKAQARSLLARA